MKRLAIFLPLLVATTTFALPPKPTNCPSVTALQGALFDYATKNGPADPWQVAQRTNNFNTAEPWTFTLFFFDVQTEQDAIVAATQSLNSLTFVQGPLPYESLDAWLCIYQANNEVQGLAITPAMDLPGLQILQKLHLS